MTETGSYGNYSQKMTLGILRFEMSQRPEVMANSLKKVTLGILRFKMSWRHTCF